MTLAEKILALHEQGIGRSTIAQKLNVTEWRVRTTVRSSVTDRLREKERRGPTKQKIRLGRVKKDKAPIQRAIVLSDIHIPYHDQKALAVALAFAQDFKPDLIILNGDICDYYGASSYRKDPGRIDTLQDEISETRAFLKHVRDLFPNARIVYLKGNHEDRLERFILDKAPELYSLDSLSMDNLLHLEEMGIEWLDEHATFMLGELEIVHGFMVRGKSGYSAMSHHEKLGGSVLIGHTHRSALVCHTNRYGQHVAIENGYLARSDVDYVIRPDWQQGFTTIEYLPDGRFFARPHLIHKGCLVADGHTYSAD